MTRRMLVICNAPSCDQLVSPDVRYCPVHKRVASQIPPVPSESGRQSAERSDQQRARHRLYDRKWKKRRAAQLAESPWCQRCLARGVYKPATDVHHIIPHRGDVSLFEISPLESLCHSCHSRHTGRENATEDPPAEESLVGECRAHGGVTRAKNSPIKTVK